MPATRPGEEGEVAAVPVGVHYSGFRRWDLHEWGEPGDLALDLPLLWHDAGGVLAGLLGGEAMDEGLASMSPVFTFMIEYYLAIALGVLIAAWLLRRNSAG